MKHWRKKAAVTALAFTLFSPLPVAGGKVFAEGQPAVTILLDDVPLAFDAPPVLDNGVTFVPFRAIGEALGISLSWDNATQTVSATGQKGGQPVSVALQVGNAAATVNGASVKLPAAPRMTANRVLIPLSFFSTQFGAKVGWTQETKTVTIVSPAKPVYLRAFYAISSFQERDLIPAMNSVAFGWSRIDEQGHFTMQGSEYNLPAASGTITPESIIADAETGGVQPYLMVYSGDGHQELTTMLSSVQLRQESIDGIAAAVEDKGFGGVVLDFEGLGFKLDKDEQASLLNEYAKQLRLALPDDTSLSLAVPPPNSNYKGYDHKTLAGIADDLIIMAYQYNPAGTSQQVLEPNSKVQQGIEQTIAAGVPKDKLLLGINMASETPQSIDDKLGLVKRYNLKGAAFWRLGLFRAYTDNMVDAVNASVTKLQQS
ncbi:stalk domain-containing protein [Paenibacillus protaetiae]|uniref:Copper amine oxidase n=1 Tax=Paenibacillus protaetiae TaxID=2509456 RepID=A0A4V0YF00_9BACL|nr:stalk domain-containing protein [Paenibacillus protaetiae]QAY65981.1 copper amine oxidase [Paenibacillus protaetiae]